jgi:hypothetical protein
MRIHFILAAVLAVLAGCVLDVDRKDDRDLDNLAQDLEERTDRFYDELRDGSSDEDAVREAGELAEAADRFERAVAAGDSRDELRDEFEALRDRYHELRDEYDADRADSDERERFEDVTTAYLEIEGSLKY